MRKLAAIAIASVTLLSQAEVVINEIMADNDGKFPNAAGEAMDWIELYNPGEMPADLTGWRITDTVEDPWSKWKEIPAGAIVPAQGYLLLWGHNKDFPTPEDAKGFCGVTNGEVHVKLGMSSKGETITLAASEADYDEKTFVDQVTFGAQFADVSYGRDPNDTAKWLFFANATPGAANGTDGLVKYPPTEQGGEEPGGEGDGDVDGPREGEFAVMLDVSRPIAGKVMKATVTGERTGAVTFAWFVREPSGAYGDAVCEGREYTPTAVDYEHWIRVTATDEGGSAASAEFYFSKLPIVYINTDDGKAVTSKEEYKAATIRIQGNDLYDQQYDGKTEIKGRGNSSWWFPKRPYKLKLAAKTDLFGYGKNKHWVLLTNWLDECFMRNYLAQDLAGTLGLVKDEMTWVNVVFNGSYQGNYMLAEHIRVDKNRIDVFDWSDVLEENGHNEEDLSWLDKVEDVDLSGGYIFELSDEYDEVSRFTTVRGLKVMVNTPEFACTSSKMFDAIRMFWEDYESAYCAEDGYNAKNIHYSELADISSMVNFWLVQEILGNLDATYKSRYACKDIGQKLFFGPVWDFDWGCGSICTTADISQRWVLANSTRDAAFFKEWLDDPYFCALSFDYYWGKVRPWAIKLLDEGGYQAVSNYLAEAGTADDVRWGPTNGQNPFFTDKSWTGAPQRGFSGDVIAFAKYLRSRITWLDEQFVSIDELVKSVRTQSVFPYAKDDGILFVSLGNGSAAGVMSATTDFVLNRGDKVPKVKTTVSGGTIVKLHTYVNGLKYGIYDVADGKCEFTVSADKLVAEPGHRDMVSLIAKDADGKTIARNYLTILNPPTYTIEFDSDGGSPVAPMTVAAGSAITAPKEPVRGGCLFDGWYEADSEVPFGFGTMPARDVRLKAHWSDGWRIPSGVLVTIETGLVGYTPKGLPTGLKYSKTTGTITGKATTSCASPVKFTKAGYEKPVEMLVLVEALPATVCGEFDGFVMIGDDNHGTFVLSATSSGSLTAKIVTAQSSYAFSKPGWDSAADGIYEATFVTKKGEMLTVCLDSTAAWDANQLSGTFVTAAIAATKKSAAVPSRSYSVSAQRNAFSKAWHFTATGDEMTGWTLAYTNDAKASSLAVTLKADGTTSIAGNLPNGADSRGKTLGLKVSAKGIVNVGMMRTGALAADFAPILTSGGKKKVLSIRTNLWFDRKNDHSSGIGEAEFVE